MRMVNKKVVITFANPKMDAMNAITDIRAAVKKVSLNLYSRHDVQLQYPMPENGKVVLELRIPEEKAAEFSYGHHLKGIAKFLKENCQGRYDPYFVGTRLLNYTEVTETDDNSNNELKPVPADKGYEAIMRLTYLLQSTDADSIKKTNEILELLEVK